MNFLHPQLKSYYQGKLLMAFKSVLNKSVVLESFEHEIMLHARGLPNLAFTEGPVTTL